MALLTAIIFALLSRPGEEILHNSSLSTRVPRVVVAGGHSAGHIEPAMNFADALRRLEPTAEITALGTVRGLDTTQIGMAPPASAY